MPIIILLVVIVLLILMIIGYYNKFVSFKNKAKEAWSSIDIQLKRRFDLIPNLVETVKGYASHEKQLLSDITDKRAMGINAKTVAEQAHSANFLSEALGKLFAVAENYPDLKANASFIELQRNLQKIEEEIQMARRYYNAVVRDNNTALEMFPGMIFANMFGFKPFDFFEIIETQRENVNVKF